MKKSTPPNDPNDLTRIRGIGPARQRWLKEKLQVESFADLAALDPDQLAEQLKAAPLSPRLEEIRQWIEAARRLAAGTPGQPAEGAEPPPPGGAPDAAADKTAEDNGEAWQPVATFIVEIQARTDGAGHRRYRTYAYQMDVEGETTVSEAFWEGIEPHRHCDWMYRRITELQGGAETPAAAAAGAAPPEPERAPAASAPAAGAVPREVRLTLTGLTIAWDGEQRRVPATGGELIPLPGGHPLDLTATIELQGADAEDLSRLRLPLIATLHLSQVGGRTHRSTTARPQRLSPGQVCYTLPLATGLALPPGTYATWIGVAVPHAGRPLGQAFPGPRLMVR